MQKVVWLGIIWPCVVAVGLVGCAARQSNVATTQQPSFTVQSPIDQIAADKAGKSVLERDVPGVMHDRRYVLYSCMSLAQVASLSGGQLTKAKLDKVNQDLAMLPPCAE